MPLLTSSIILKEFMKEFRAASQYTKLVDKQYTDKFGEQSGDVAKGGTTIQVKTPQQVTVRSGRASTFLNPDEGSRALTVDQMRGVDLKFTDVDLELSVDAFRERFVKSAASALAATVDSAIAVAAYRGIPKALGTPGTTPSALKTFNTARGRLVDANAPVGGDLSCILNTDANVEMVDALKGLFANQTELDKQYTLGYMGRAAGMKWYESAHVPTHQVGPLGGTPLVNGANQGIATGWAETTSLVTDGWTASAAARLRAGDVITFANVFDVDPLTKTNRSYLKQFVVTADYSSDGSGNLTAVISPAIIRGGAYQNVSGAPADNAAITVLGTANTNTPQNMIWTKEAVTLATVPLLVPRGTDMAERMEFDGISLRLVRDWDNANAELNTRIDVFYGIKVMMPEWGVRVAG